MEQLASVPTMKEEAEAVWFPWFEFGHNSPVCKDVQPMALAVRAILVIEYQVATAEEHGEDSGMTLLGFTSTLRALAQQGGDHAVGDFLGALENTIPAYARRDWPAL